MKRAVGLTLVVMTALLFLTQVSGQHHQETESQAKENKILSYFPVSTGTPTIPDKYKVTSIEQLLPGTRYYLEHGTQLKKAKQVLIVVDSKTGDPMITDAWARAARELGGVVDVVTLDLTSHHAA